MKTVIPHESTYQTLEDLLVVQQWKEADEETGRILLQLSDRASEGYINKSHALAIPTSDLQWLDRLWREHSYNHFGFSIQQQIWNLSYQNYAEFGQRVGWRSQEIWLDYDRLTFSLQAPLGHLPVAKLLIPVGDHPCFSFVLGTWRIALLSRRDL
ncbi:MULTISPECIES: GUN4 domain-containing protein [unclassified Roseofilum]|uniref:GUN4 domain-containing protein n=1 Tax=unclassified Roseofilum TaxID=2620099 RepID=UPI000E9FD647|nr:MULTISPECIES: GUN4 domain-containing protein [unclassified Roseofilum]MBP0006958.1 GUN4 domain-containing protein [Roseofilum sp. Belize Diploria]MBP0032865.1 GUN4 domain-containing protein [Roseofilum sp. Belize BBD 4]HBQ99504.1 serine/threonine kinase [Cyanobacteria bacterium UBA11691]